MNHKSELSLVKEKNIQSINGTRIKIKTDPGLKEEKQQQQDEGCLTCELPDVGRQVRKRSDGRQDSSEKKTPVNINQSAVV